MTGIKRRNRTEREWNLAVTILERVGFAHVDQFRVEVLHVIRRYLRLTETSFARKPGSKGTTTSTETVREFKRRTSQTFWSEICFPEKQKRLTGENIPGGWLLLVTTRASLQRPSRRPTQTMQKCGSGRPRLGQRNYIVLLQKQFLNNC